VKAVECEREQDVIAAVVSGRWPGRCEAELRTHVAACEICRDVADVAVAFGAGREAAWESIQLPSAAHMWWRLQMRARQDAARAAIRPIAVVQGLVAAAIAAVTVVIIGFGLAARWWLPLDLETGPRQAAAGAVDALTAMAAAAPQTMVLLGAIAAGLVLMPVAVYFALSE
jgi:hypothetical protein